MKSLGYIQSNLLFEYYHWFCFERLKAYVDQFFNFVFQAWFKDIGIYQNIIADYWSTIFDDISDTNHIGCEVINFDYAWRCI